MARPHGFDHFCTFLNGLEAHYVIIGGGAAALLMDEGGLEFRATKDVDLVVLSRSTDLNERIITYVREGKYQVNEATNKSPRYYRFKTPENKECPSMIEIFARNELHLQLRERQHIIPIAINSAEQLSAILLDDEYFDLIQKNQIISASGIPLINAIANICLKARAHRELLERWNAGDTTVDEKDINKHLKDIWRIAANLTGDENIDLTGKPLEDVTFAIKKLDLLSDTQFKQVMEKVPGAKKETFMSVLKKVF